MTANNDNKLSLSPHGERCGLPDSMSILVVDDDPAARRLVIEALREMGLPGLRMLQANTLSMALSRLEREDPDLCVSDFRLSPNDTALDLFRAARARGILAPFIGITGNLLEEDLAETLLTAGFDDVLLKSELGATNLYRVLRNAALRSRSSRRLLEIGTSDDMTGALNRRGFLSRLEIERRRCGDECLVLSLLYLDLDNLKCVNDRYGHRAGDQMIRSMVAELRPLLRRCDAIGRLGGDEFCVVLPGADEAMARRVASRLRQRLSQNPLMFGGRLIEVRASVGVHTVERAQTTTADEMVDRADQAMFRDKQISKARVSGRPC